ncbi:hypothetical protein ACWGSE_18910 [Streptomyces diastaticus]|uniref:hypothetical protein n=1 Tax=Streptomyces diastaticus group TaxID=2849069 RepID=UPI0013C62C32|nr:hypothetical protein [Streptomyces rutgersensis]GFH64447.1 hypothetical protein Srut_09610 [Streptomyces rutgersensis]
MAEQRQHDRQASPSRLSRRRETVAELRSQGRAGPELRDVLPGFAGMVLVTAGPMLGLAWLYRVHGIGALLLGALLLAAATLVGVPWRRAVVRRRGGRYTPAELAVLDDHGLAVAAERILRRDGWHVLPVPDDGRPRLYARDRRDRRLEVSFRPVDDGPGVAEPPGGPATLREPGGPADDRVIRVVISMGTYSPVEVEWASRPGGDHLVDGRRLQQWASGTSLDALGLLG